MEMRGYAKEEKAGMGGGGIVAFLLLISATAGAFFATDAGAFRSAPTARIAVLLPQDGVASTEAGSIDRSFTSSAVNLTKAAEPICNHEACARAYRSFRSSDC